MDLLLRRQLEQRTVASAPAIFQYPDGTVRSLCDLTYATLQVKAFRLTGAFSIELDTHQPERCEAADKTAALPLRKKLAVIDNEACR